MASNMSNLVIVTCFNKRIMEFIAEFFNQKKIRGIVSWVGIDDSLFVMFVG